MPFNMLLQFNLERHIQLKACPCLIKLPMLYLQVKYTEENQTAHNLNST